MNPFRESAEQGVDKTQVECTRITQAEQTKRDRMHEKESTRRENIKTDGYHFVRGMWVFSALIAIICGGVIATNLASKNPAMGPCFDEARNDRTCPHLLHVGHVDQGQFVCTCPHAAVVPVTAPAPSH